MKKKDFVKHVKNCEICLKNKYERHPKLHIIGQAPIPKKVGEMLHLDIFYIGNEKYLTCLDKLSKFLHVYPIRIKTEIPTLIEQILVTYPNCVNITTDNDVSFSAQPVQSILNLNQIKHYKTPVSHSTTNGQIERVHSTLLELIRILSEQRGEPIAEVIFQAAKEYNNSIHSVTKIKPVELFFHSDKYPDVSNLLQKTQEKVLTYFNKKRKHKVYEPGEVIYVKTDRRNKALPRYIKHTVAIDKNETIITDKGKDIHKDNIRK